MRHNPSLVGPTWPSPQPEPPSTRHPLHAGLPPTAPSPTPVPAVEPWRRDAYTFDHHALVGFAPGVPHTILGCGFSGHGFKMSPAIGAALADLAVDGSTSLPVGHQQPARFTQPPPAPRLRTIAADLTTTPSAGQPVVAASA